MHATARRPLWVRVGAGILATILFLTNTIYPWISLLPAPPIVVVQEELPLATTSAEATPAASVATSAPSPLDPLDQLENEILLSTTSAEIVLPEEAPEDPISTPSSVAETPSEVPPERDVVGPTPSSEGSTTPPTDLKIRNQVQGDTDKTVLSFTEYTDDLPLPFADTLGEQDTPTPLPPTPNPDPTSDIVIDSPLLKLDFAILEFWQKILKYH